MATSVKRRATARRTPRKAVASTARRRGKTKVGVRRTAAKVKPKAKAKGAIARLAARARKALGIKKAAPAAKRARNRRLRAAQEQALIDLPPSMPV